VFGYAKVLEREVRDIKMYFLYSPVIVLHYIQENMERRRFRKIVENLVTKLISFAPVDAACDQMAKQFLQNSLPPVLTEGICLLYVVIKFFVTAWFLGLYLSTC